MIKVRTSLIIGIIVILVLAGIVYYLTTIPTPEVVTTTTPLTTFPITTTTLLTTTTIPPTTTVATTTVITTTQVTTTTPVADQGILVMKIKDKLNLTNVTSINITISRVGVHKAGIDKNETASNETFETNDTSSAGWEIISDETKSYNLLELVDTPGEVMGETTLSAGKYTQIRLYVSKAELTLDNETYDVKVPSKRFYWIHPFYIEAGKMTTLTLDFDASESIKETGSNKFILKPVVKIIGQISTTTTSTTTTSSTTESTTTTTIHLGPYISQIEPVEEWVKIISDNETNMTGWTLHDNNSIHVYSFPTDFLLLGTVKVHTEYGVDNSTDLYWNLSISVWNDDHDVATLKDDEGTVIHQKSY